MYNIFMKKGTQASYNAMQNRDANTMYFCTDTGNMYMGDTQYTGKIVFDKPEVGVVGTIYVKDGAWTWDGEKYVSMTAPLNTTDTITGSDALATDKAVKAYVDEATKNNATVESDLETAKGDIEALEGDMTTAKEDIANLKSNKADKATTLGGYGITDAYTSEQVDNAIATAVANADHLKRSIVDALPEVASADEHTIYMVLSGDQGDSQYDEYMLVNGRLELIGKSAVDLTDYATKTYAEEKATAAKTEAISTAAEDATQKANAAQTAAQNYADGLAQNYATAAQGAKADTALQQADITTGAENGTIAVKGTDVAVKGLGSAAFTNADAYDASGRAAVAEQNSKAYTDAAMTWGTF